MSDLPDKRVESLQISVDDITSLELQLDILKKRNEKLEKVVSIVRQIRSLDPEPIKRFGSTKQANELIAQIDPALQALDEVKAK